MGAGELGGLRIGEGYVFVHVPRTGGHTAYDMLGPSMSPTHATRSEIGHPDSYGFGFIRNPWERLFSCFVNQQSLAIQSANSTFENYLDECGIVGNSALHFLEGCDFIGRFEHFEADWLHILETIDHPRPAFIPWLNEHRVTADYREHYTPELVDLIAERHADDIAYGDYTFE